MRLIWLFATLLSLYKKGWIKSNYVYNFYLWLEAFWRHWLKGECLLAYYFLQKGTVESSCAGIGANVFAFSFSLACTLNIDMFIYSYSYNSSLSCILPVLHFFKLNLFIRFILLNHNHYPLKYFCLVMFD